jgi:diguanylate cyclase (GGDEF)-like protein/PAS domain S-box-containing protein
MKSTERIIQRQLRSEIKHRKQLELVAQDALEYATGIIDTIRDPLIVLDADLKIISASRSFYRIFKVKRENTEKQYIFDLGNHQWNIPKLRELLENILPNETSFDDYEVEHVFPGIGKRTMVLNARKIYSEAGHAQLILLAIEDITKRKEAEEKLMTLANCDELTGCANFRSIMKIIENEIARSTRYQTQFNIIMIDIDQLKRINDEYGHLTGNNVLVAFADSIKNCLRSVDIVGRYGGDEFIVILPETDSQHALMVLEKVRNAFNRTKLTLPHVENAKELALEFSAGIASFPRNAGDIKELIWVVDSALLKAKQKGKNQAVIERRGSIRLNLVSGTRIEMVDSSGKTVKNLKIGDISKEGMLLLSTQDIHDKELLCRMYSPKGKSPVELICKVRHKGKGKNELYRIGVYFLKMSESIKEKLSNCIEFPTKQD